MKSLLLASTCAVLLVALPARAAVTISSGQFGGTGVHSTPGLSASTVTGLAGTDLVTLTTTGDLLDTSGGGESDYDAHDGLMDDLTVTFTNNYDSVTFNLNVPNKGTTGFSLSVNGGAFNFTESGLGNGQNKFRLDATAGDFIHSLAFTFTGSQIEDIRQIRVGNVVIPGGPKGGGIPEPATWAMMITGFAGMGAMLRRRRRALVRA